MDETQFKKLNEKLNAVIRLLAIQSLSGKTDKEAITALSAAGFPPKDIAELLGTTSNTVRVTLAKIKRGNSHDRRKKA